MTARRTRRADRVEAETDDEIRLHFELRVADLMARGRSRREAEDEALRRFGPFDTSRAEMLAAARHRERRLTMLDRFDAVRHDLAYALRQIRGAPALAVTVALTFALGVGANATMFGIVDRLLLRAPAHVSAPHELVKVETWSRRFETAMSSFSYPGYVAVRDGVPALSHVAMTTYPNPVSLGSGADARSIDHVLVSGNYFQTLGVRMALGRSILPEDDVLPTGSPVAVIGHELWRNTFGGRPDILGSRIELASGRFTVVGVAPPGFHGTGSRRIDLWIPVSAAEGLRFAGKDWATTQNTTWMSLVGRLRPGMTPAVAGEQVAAVVRAQREARTGKPDTTTFAMPLTSILPDRQPTLSAEKRVALLLGLVSVLVLLIACANVANLLLARAVQRRREIAVRLALGISRRRLVGQLVVEGVLLALLGGAVALAVVRWGSAFVQTVLFADHAWPASPIDGRMLAFTAGATMLIGLLAALVPALQASSPNLSRSLREGSRGSGVSHSRTRTALLLTQAALAAVLLVGAGLFVTSLRRVADVRLGIDLDRLAIASIDLESVRMDSAAREEYYRRALERARALPGVERAVLAEATPFSDWTQGIGPRVPGLDSLPHFEEGPYRHSVQDGYFATVGTRILRGREFTAEDLLPGAEPVVILNEPAARLIWPGEDALAKCLHVEEEGPCARVVGLAEDTHRNKVVEEGRRMQVYVPFGRHDRGLDATFLIARSTGEPETIVEPLRRMMQTVQSGLPFADVRPMHTMLDRELRPWRLGATMFGVFGAIAIVLSALGLYGVVAYSVAQRTHEMGVRVALGAQPGDILRMVLSHGLAIAAAGIVVGLVLALAGGRFVEPLLFEVSPRDPRVLGGVAFVLLATAAVASLVPARRATRADPMEALRAE